MSRRNVPWKRFWRRFDDTNHLGEGGFLPDPEEKFALFPIPTLFTLDQLLAEPCLVLCGNPGIGKTTELQKAKTAIRSELSKGENLIWLEFRDIPNESVFARRTFDSATWQTWRRTNEKLVLVVDGVDEGRLKIPDFVSYLTGQLRSEPLDRLQLVLACRSADWPVAAGSELTALWGTKDQPPVFDLCPLRQRDAELAAQVKGLDQRAFIRAVFQNQILGMAALPTTLFFLLQEFQESGQFSGSHRDLFEKGCFRLLCEHDPQRLEGLRALRKTARVFSPQERKLAASRLAALLLLCGKSAIYAGPVGDVDANADLHLNEALDAIGNATTIGVSEDLVLETIGTGLFTSRGPNRFGFAHQTYAESLAAQFLNGLPLIQVRSLLCGRDEGEEHVVPQLAETAAWLAGMREDFFDHLCRIEPEALLRSDVAKVQGQRKAALVSAILEAARQAQLFDEVHNISFYASLNYPGIAKQLADCVADKSLNVVVRRMALEIAGECHLTELSGNLFGVIQDSSEIQQIRERAARALVKVLPDERLSELIPFVGPASEPDPDDNITGVVLHRLVPKIWSVAQALPVLRRPNQDVFGDYQMLLKYHLPRHLTESDLPQVLARLIRWTHCFDPVNPFDELADAAFGEALQRLGSPSIRRGAIRVWLVKQKRNHPLPHGKDSKVRTLLDQREDIRRSFLDAILNDAKTRTSDVGHLNGAFVQLVLPADLHWLLDQIVAVAPDRRPAWAEAVAMAACAEATVGCWDLFLERLDAVPELKARFEWLRAWSVDEPIAQRAKSQWLTEQGWKKRLAKRREGPNIEELVKQDLECIAAGQTAAWIQLRYHLAMKEGDSQVVPWGQYDVTEYPGWKRSSPERQQQIVSAARQFLVKHSDGYAEFGSRTNYAVPGYLAVWLLRDTVLQDAELSTAIAANWIGALVGYWDDGTGHYQVTAALAYGLNPKATLQAFERRVKEDDERHGQTHCQHGFEKVWDEGFTTAALKLVGSGTLKAGSIEAILGFVATVARTEATGCARHMISTLIAASNPPRDQLIAVLSACLWKMPSDTWCDIWPVLDADTGLAEAVILRVADRIGYTREDNMLSALSEQQLADFYLKVRTLFPPTTDPKLGTGFGLVSSRMCVTDLRGKLVTALEARGTESACRELLRLANTIPEEGLGLRWCYYGARTSKRRKAWVPPVPQTVLGLVARGEARLVQTVADLQEVVLESLGRLQVHLTQRTLPRAEDLWQWEGSDPKRHGFRHKDEAALSDYIACWLRDDLVENRIVIGRELQPRRGQRTDIDVTAVAAATVGGPASELKVVIEVKGCWHAEVRNAAETQLVADYLRPNGLSHGIYLVGWFVCPQWAVPKNELNSQTLEDARREVADLVAPFDGRANPERVRAFVLDCRYPGS